jgi:hypothetical protein
MMHATPRSLILRRSVSKSLQTPHRPLTGPSKRTENRNEKILSRIRTVMDTEDEPFLPGHDDRNILPRQNGLGLDGGEDDADASTVTFECETSLYAGGSNMLGPCSEDVVLEKHIKTSKTSKIATYKF